LAAPGQSDRRRANHVGDLDRGDPDAARSGRNQNGVPGRELGDPDQRAIGGEIHHPGRRRLLEGQIGRVFDDGESGREDKLAIKAIIVQRKGRCDAHRVADVETLDAFADGLDFARGLIAETGRELWLLQILPHPEHHLGAVQANRLDANANLARPRGGDVDVNDEARPASLSSRNE
jgi:hypothetical protein